ncbi:hypothetical protein MHYP_G00280620 [Metynnis hypsauchen]
MTESQAQTYQTQPGKRQMIWRSPDRSWQELGPVVRQIWEPGVASSSYGDPHPLAGPRRAGAAGPCTRQVPMGSKNRRDTTNGRDNPCPVREMDEERARQTFSFTSRPLRLPRRRQRFCWEVEAEARYR